MALAAVAVAVVVVALVGGPLLYSSYELLCKWLRARRARRIFKAQGVKCLPRAFLSGNIRELSAIGAKARAHPMAEVSHATAPRVLPHLFVWSKTYGEEFTYWFGFQPRYVLNDPEQAKELLLTKSGHFTKVLGTPDIRDVSGDGLGTLDGEKWARHRRILNPAFFLEKLKNMAPVMAKLTLEMTKKWGSSVDAGESIDVAQEFRDLSADIIAHTAFGSSFAEGKLVFELMHKQQELFFKLMTALHIPGSRFLPTAQNRRRKDINSKICGVLRQIIQKRLDLAEEGEIEGYGNDLLGLMLAANKGQLHGNQNTLSMGLDELIDECRAFLLAGHDTTATLFCFAFMLLARHPEWQERAREEVFEVCGRTELPDAGSLNHLKLVGMVINETLRLYPSAPYVLRKSPTDRKLGKILVPGGTVIVLPIMAWHQDKRFWGPDAADFRPDRFEEGVSKACKVPGTYLPFSYGPRNCIGQVFANIEGKMVLATMLQRYRFHLSPKYRHAPTVAFTLRPQFGMPMIFENLQ